MPLLSPCLAAQIRETSHPAAAEPATSSRPADDTENSQKTENSTRTREAKPLANQPVAIVLGRAIAYYEIDRIVKNVRGGVPKAELPELDIWEKSLVYDLKNTLQETSDPALFRLVLRNKAEWYLLVETARRYISELRDKDILRQLIENDPGKKEEEFIESIDYYREFFLVMLFQNAKMGIGQTIDGITPTYADFIRVPPKEVRASYKKLKAAFEPAASKRIAKFTFPGSNFKNSNVLKQALEECLGELQQDAGLSEKELGDLSKKLDGCSFDVLDIPEKGNTNQPPVIAEFARSGAVGDVSSPITLSGGGAVIFVVLYVMDRIEERIPEFAECRDNIRRSLIANKREIVHRLLIKELIQTSDFSPPDLFETTPRTRGSSSRQPADSKEGG